MPLQAASKRLRPDNWPLTLPSRNFRDLSDGAVIVRNMGKSGGSGEGQGFLNTQYCVGCKSRKSIRGFNVVQGLCAECSDERRVHRGNAARKGAKSKKSKKPSSNSSGPKTWKCPNCVKRIDVDLRRTTLVDHLNAKGKRCAGSGFPLPQRSQDALDYRVAGSFEGGR